MKWRYFILFSFFIYIHNCIMASNPAINNKEILVVVIDSVHVSKNKSVINIQIVNHSNKTYTFSDTYILKIYKNRSWITIPSNNIFSLIEYELPANSTMEYKQFINCEISRGIYKLTKTFESNKLVKKECIFEY